MVEIKRVGDHHTKPKQHDMEQEMRTPLAASFVLLYVKGCIKTYGGEKKEQVEGLAKG